MWAKVVTSILCFLMVGTCAASTPADAEVNGPSERQLPSSAFPHVTGAGSAWESPSKAEPLRAAFFYPWFPNAWGQSEIEPFTNFTPSFGSYDSSDRAIIERQLALAKRAHIDVFIASWWGQGHHTDKALHSLLAATTAPDSLHPSLEWAVYYEEEGQSDPTATAIAGDLTYLKTEYFSHPAYLKIDGKPVVFVWTQSTDREAMLVRWHNAQTILGDRIYVVPKVYQGYRDSSHQPDSWHQYGPAEPTSQQLPYSYTVSPGFWLVGENERLSRDPARFEQDVIAMNNSGASWQLITTWNEWGEGTAIEPADEFGTTYIDILADNPPPGSFSTPEPDASYRQRNQVRRW